MHRPSRASRCVATVLPLVLGIALIGCGDQGGYEEPAASQSETDALADQVDALESEIQDLEGQIDKARVAPYESADAEAVLDEGEWQQGLVAAQDYLANDKIGNMALFIDAVAKLDGIYWSPLEKAAFRERYSEWYARNG